MGVVYHAIDPNIGRPVAIKTIPLGSTRTPEEQERLRERLFREARSAGILSHPGIVTIYDVEQQGDIAYIAMEYVDGPTLDAVLSGPQTLTPEEMFSILGQTAVALDYAHGKGIVHRDIKPANIMIAGDGTVKITDFGIAKVTAGEQFTMTGSIVGTPHYMSPEQVQGQAMDGRSDQFSLAVIGFEMLTGEKPYTGEHLTTVVYKIVAEEPVPPQRLNPSLSGQIDAVVRKSLSKKVDARYRNCQEYIEALEGACAASKGWKTMARGGSLNAPTMVDTPKSAVTLPPPRRPQRSSLDSSSTRELKTSRKSSFITFLLAILVAAGLLALIGLQSASKSKAPPKKTASEAAKRVEEKKAEPAPEPVAKAAPPPAADENKPSPVGTPVNPPVVDNKTAVKEEPLPKVEPKAPAKRVPVDEAAGKARGKAADTPQAVTIISSPGGATATIDGRASCRTPCSLDALPGRHTLSVVLPGYQVEQRQVDLGSSPQELPAIMLRAQSGTLMLTSSPSGATVLVNGKSIGRVTPARSRYHPASIR